MFARLLVAIALFAASLAPGPARAQDVAEVQAVLAEMGAWMQRYQGLMTGANQSFIDLGGYIAAIDQFNEGDISEAEARAGVEAWRTRALAAIAAARAGAHTLGEPPVLAAYGPEGAQLDRVLRVIRDNLRPTLDEMERLANAVAELGLSAISDPAKAYDVRARAYYLAAIQVVQMDRARVDVAAVSLPRVHPTQPLMAATQHYYDNLVAVPRYAIEELDGGGDRAALVASLRASAHGMRVELARSRDLSDTLLAEARQRQAGYGVELTRVMVRMLETFPASIRAYEGLAEGIDTAAAALERGEDVADVWSQQEADDAPYLLEIDRIDALRAQMLAEISRTAL